MDFFLLDTTGDLNDETLGVVKDSPAGMGLKDYKLARGKPAREDVPPDVELFLDPDSAGMVLKDVLGNLRGYFLGSAKVVETIRSSFPELNVEFIPFTLRDQKERVCKAEYSFVNPLDHRECLHEAKSEIEYDEDGTVLMIKDYVIDKTKAENLPHLFRIAEDPGKYVFSRDFGRAMQAAGVKGLQGILLEQA
ncbi:MAG: hypothetical protein HKN13_12640 [Rhodothermales bacterium]|nr:hypothetical protein [Rhodothermales bacterium]